MKKINILIVVLLNYAALCATQKTNEKVFISSIPKCGTNLLIKLMSLLTDQAYDTNSQNFLIIDEYQAKNSSYTKYFLTHAIASPENINLIQNNNYKAIFILRDPRDQVVSFTHYIYKLSDYWPKLCNLPFNELLMLLITDISCIKNDHLWAIPELYSFHSIDSFYQAYLPWTQQPFVYTTYFEKLVGPNGGGSAEEQIIEIINITNHIGIELTKNEAQRIADSLFGNTGTFHEGRIGSWKNYFKQEHINTFKQVAGQLLIDLGYEKDFNW